MFAILYKILCADEVVKLLFRINFSNKDINFLLAY